LSGGGGYYSASEQSDRPTIFARFLGVLVTAASRLTGQHLLRDYTGRHSEAAFAELVRRHIDFVHSGARISIGLS